MGNHNDVLITPTGASSSIARNALNRIVAEDSGVLVFASFAFAALFRSGTAILFVPVNRMPFFPSHHRQVSMPPRYGTTVMLVTG